METANLTTSVFEHDSFNYNDVKDVIQFFNEGLDLNSTGHYFVQFSTEIQFKVFLNKDVTQKDFVNIADVVKGWVQNRATITAGREVQVQSNIMDTWLKKTITVEREEGLAGWSFEIIFMPNVG